MPRIGQLLSALLIALIGVLVVQMFLFAGMEQRLPADRPPPVPGMAALPAPTTPARMAAIATQAPTRPRPATLVIVVMTAQARPTVGPAPATMLDLPAALPPQQPPSDGGEALIERFIALTSERLGPSSAEEEVAP